MKVAELFEGKKAEPIPPKEQYPMQMSIDADAVHNPAAINKYLARNSQVLDMMPDKGGSADFVFVAATAKQLNLLWDEFFATPYKEMRLGRKPAITAR